jgi:SAM-dependent methyltransferase
VAALPSRPIVMVVGAIVVVAGLVLWWRLTGSRPDVPTVGLLLVCLAVGQSAGSPCQHETAYYCVRVVARASDPSVRDLYLDRLRHASVDLDDPTVLDIGYVRLLADVADALPAGPLDTLHVGGGGFTLPRYLQEVRPGGRDVVVEIDRELVDIATDELGLVEGGGLEVRVGDGRLALAEQADDSLDLVIGDAFGSQSVPWHLTTEEVAQEIHRGLRPGGVYAMNVLDGGDNRFARAQLATLATVFDHVAVLLTGAGGRSGLVVNQVLVASDAPLPDLAVADGVRILTGDDLDAYVDGAEVLTDDHAPVDQLVHR